MITQDQVKELSQRTEALHKYLKIDEKRARVSEDEARSQAPGFWDDPKEAEAFLKKMNSVKAWVTAYDKLHSQVDDLDVLLELDPEGEDTDKAYAEALNALEDLELKNMLGAEGDNLGAVLTINSGAGGTEANDCMDLKQPLVLTGTEDKYDVKADVHGGGFTGQAGAIRLGITRALLEAGCDRKVLKTAGMITRDPRKKERKKYGLKAARKAPQFSKR